MPHVADTASWGGWERWEEVPRPGAAGAVERGTCEGGQGSASPAGLGGWGAGLRGWEPPEGHAHGSPGCSGGGQLGATRVEARRTDKATTGLGPGQGAPARVEQCGLRGAECQASAGGVRDREGSGRAPDTSGDPELGRASCPEVGGSGGSHTKCHIPKGA